VRKEHDDRLVFHAEQKLDHLINIENVLEGGGMTNEGIR